MGSDGCEFTVPYIVFLAETRSAVRGRLPRKYADSEGEEVERHSTEPFESQQSKDIENQSGRLEEIGETG